jgi:hypothetical protein
VSREMTDEERKKFANGCFGLIIAILGAFALGGIYGWPFGVFALMVALISFKLAADWGDQ